jgi:hypothetical protein
VASPLSETRGVREMSAASDRDGVGEADGGLMLPLVLGPEPRANISAGFGFPHVGKVLEGAPMGKYVEEAQELPVNLTSGRHDTRQTVVGGTRPGGVGLALPCHLGACRGLEELVDMSRSCPLRPTSLRWLPQNSWVQAMSMSDADRHQCWHP